MPGMLGDLSLSVDRIQEASPIVGGFLVGYVSALPLFGAASDARGRRLARPRASPHSTQESIFFQK